jgi:hypothetical protein
LRLAVERTIWIFLSFLGCGIAEERQPIDICEIVRHAERYQDKIVAVSGFYVSGPHGATIMNEQCGFRNRYRAFGLGAAAAVEYDLQAATEKYRHGDVDQESIQRFSDAYSKAGAAASSGEITARVTVSGLIGVADHYSLRDYGDRGSEGTGFGQMGVYPVQVTILAVRSFSIRVRKAVK